MSIDFNGTELTGHNFNGVDLTGHVHNTVLVFGEDAPAPTEIIDDYQLLDDISALIDGTGAQLGYKLVINSGTGYPGLLCLANGDAYVPTIEQYPGDGTLDLSDGKYIDHQRVLSPDTNWSIHSTYNVLIPYYDAYTIVFYGATNTIDIYLYSRYEEVPCSPTYSGLSYTPPLSNWKTYENPPDIIFMDSVEYSMKTIVEPIVDTYVSFGSQLGILPFCVNTITHFTDGSIINIDQPLLDSTGVSEGMTLAWDAVFSSTSASYPVSGDDSGFLFDAQYLEGFYYNTEGVSAPHTFTVKGLNPAYTYTFEIAASSTTAGRYTKYTMNSNVTELAITNNWITGATEAGITGVTTFDIIVDAVIANDPFMFVMGLNIKRTA